ncbi:MAG: dockerin type I repeat-containing protein [Clostridia bacterium]|nr:dockerin type I repeat-containing protein [Clostridia bacterium]
MKKKFLKSVALIMCVVITCLTLSVGSVAASGNVYEIDELDGFSVDSVETNESGTIAILTINHYLQYAVTMNGKDYTILNFDKYLPQGSEWISVLDYTINGDTFVFLLRAYKMEIVKEKYYDEYEDEYYYEENENQVATHHMVLTTTDFVSYEKYNANFDLNVYSNFDTEERGSIGTILHCFGDKFVYIGDLFEVTKVVDGGRYVRGICYTTTDFINWEKHYTPEVLNNEKSWDNEAYYSIFFKSKVLNNYIVIEYQEGEIYDIVYHKFAYATKNMDKYVMIFKDNSDDFDYTSEYIECNNKIYRYDCVYNSSYNKYVENRFVAVDLDNENEREILKTKLKYWMYISYYNQKEDSLYYIIEKENGDVEAYIFDSRNNSFNKKDIDYNLSEGELYGFRGDYLFFYANNALCISDTGSPLEYEKHNITSFGFNKEYIDVFILNDKVYLIENMYLFESTEDEYKTRVAETDIVLNKQKPGDLNDDNKINSSDALLVLQSATGIINLTQEQKSFADVNKDGKINAGDALLILQFATNLISGF